MAKVGRPPFEITEDVLKKTEALASQGLTRDQIASVLGVSESTIYKTQRENSQFLQAIKDGQAKGVATISNALFNNAKNGNITAQIFYLKNRAPGEWKDKQDHELTGKDGASLAPQVIVIKGRTAEERE